MRQSDRTRVNWPRLLRSRRAAPFGVLVSAALLAGCGVTQRNPVPDADGPHLGQAGSEMGPAEGGGAGASAGTGGATQINLMGEPKHYRFVRLTNAQWAASVKEVVGLDPSPDVVANLPTPTLGISEFSNNERALEVDARLWDDFQRGAEDVAARATASDAAVAAVYPGTDVTGFIETVGRRAYRRPLTADEVAALKALFDAGAAQAGEKSVFAKGAALVIRGLLQSPYFLYRTELGEAGAPLSGYEAAAKLSLWLRGVTPTEALLDLAPKLTTADALEAEAVRMLEEDSARDVMRGFHDEYLRLAALDQYVSTVGDPDPSLAGELRESATLFFDRIFREAGLREMLTSTRGFVGAGLAPLYGLEAPASGLVLSELGERRAGYFSQSPYLALHGFNETPHSLRRGLSIALDVLCSKLPPDDSSVIPPLEPWQEGQTNRQRITAYTAECGGACHNEIMNPLGFAFEHFDGMGRYRETERGLPIDSSGSFTFDEGRREFRDHVELMSQIAESRQAHLCYAKKIAGYALQRDIVEADLPLLGELATLSQSGGSLKRIMRALARSEAFRTHFGGSP